MLPPKLSELFREIVHQGNGDNGDDGARCLRLRVQWIGFSRRQLTLPGYYYTAICGLSPGELSEWDPKLVTVEDMKRFLLSSSKGLAESNKTVDDGNKFRVQFIHESVREYFLKHGLAEIFPGLTTTALRQKGHLELQSCCHSYLEHITKLFGNTTKTPEKDRWALMDYAMTHALHHAENVAAGGVPQALFLRDFSEKCLFSPVFKQWRAARDCPTSNIPYFLAVWGFPTLITTAFRSNSDLKVVDDGIGYKSAFFAALERGDCGVVRALLQLDEKNEHLMAWLKYGPVSPKIHPLSWAIREEHYGLAKHMIETTDGINVNRDWPINYAAAAGQVSLVSLLLETGADLRYHDDTGYKTLFLALLSGETALVSLLFPLADHSSQTMRLLLLLAAKYCRLPMVRTVVKALSTLELDSVK